MPNAPPAPSACPGMVTAACSRACSGSALRDANAALAPDADNFHFARQYGRSPLQSLPGISVSLTGHLQPRQRARLLCRSQSPRARTTSSSSVPLTFVHSHCAPIGSASSASLSRSSHRNQQRPHPRINSPLPHVRGSPQLAVGTRLRPGSQKESTASLILALPVEDRSATPFPCLLAVC